LSVLFPVRRRVPRRFAVAAGGASLSAIAVDGGCGGDSSGGGGSVRTRDCL